MLTSKAVTAVRLGGALQVVENVSQNYVASRRLRCRREFKGKGLNCVKLCQLYTICTVKCLLLSSATSACLQQSVLDSNARYRNSALRGGEHEDNVIFGYLSEALHGDVVVAAALLFPNRIEHPPPLPLSSIELIDSSE